MFAQFTDVRFKFERPETDTPDRGARSRREPFRHPCPSLTQFYHLPAVACPGVTTDHKFRHINVLPYHPDFPRLALQCYAGIGDPAGMPERETAGFPGNRTGGPIMAADRGVFTFDNLEAKTI